MALNPIQAFKGMVGAVKTAMGTNTNANGVNAIQPASPTTTLPALSSNQTIKPTVPTSYSADTQKLQQTLNKQNSGQAGWVPLKEDGILGPKTQAAQTWKPTPVNTPTSTPTSAPTPAPVINPGPDTTREGLLTTLAQKGTKSGPEYDKAMEVYNKALQDYNASVQNEAKTMGFLGGTPMPLSMQQGYKNILQNQYTQQQAGLGGLVTGASNVLGAANTQQQMQTGAIQNALSQQAPFSVTPGNTVISPTGTPVYGLGAKNGAGDYQAFQNLQANTGAGIDYAQQAQAMVPQINTLSNNFNQLSPLISRINASGASGINTVRQMFTAQGDSAGLAAFDAAYQGFSNSIEGLVQGLGGEQKIATTIPGFIQDLVALRNKSLSVDGMKNLYEQVFRQSQNRAVELQNQGKTMSGAGTTSPSNIPLNIGASSGNTASAGGYNYQLVNGKWEVVK